MKQKILLLAFCLAPAVLFAATIPAGTPLLVRTTETILSDEPVGKAFGAQIARDVIVAGSVVLRAGTSVLGRIDSRRSSSWSSSPVILNVTQVAHNERLVPIKTVSGFRASTTISATTRHGVRIARGGAFLIPGGTLMEFRLAQPVNL